MCSCSSNGGVNGDSSNSQKETPMRYTVSFSDDFAFPVKSIIVFECAENGDKIYENEFVSGRGESKTFTAQPHAKKVKVYLSLTNILDLDPFSKGINGWLPLVYYLSPNETKVIRIDNHVRRSQFEP